MLRKILIGGGIALFAVLLVIIMVFATKAKNVKADAQVSLEKSWAREQALQDSITQVISEKDNRIDSWKQSAVDMENEMRKYRGTLDSLKGFDINGDSIPEFFTKASALPAPAPVVSDPTKTTPRAVLVSSKTTAIPYPRKGEFVIDSVGQKIWMLASDKGKLNISKDYEGWEIGTKPR